MNTEQSYQHWHLTVDDDKILWLGLDKADSSANTLNEPLLMEFNDILDDIEKDSSLKAVVLYSEKSSGFIAGADIEQFTKLESTQHAIDLIRKGQQLFDKVERSKVPFVAMISGFCLGGGLELALACQFRVAEDDRKTRLGLPEVMLGIHPGWGGTIRLPKLIGAPNAMDLILSGRTVAAKAAAKMGFVDAAVPKRHLKRAAKRYAMGEFSKHQPTKLQALTNHAIVRPLLAKVLRKKVAAKAKQAHYPAPYAVIDNWVSHGVDNYTAMVEEANSIGKLFMTDTSKNLVRVFFLQERLKGLAKGSEFKPKRVHVIGAGVMGGDIAAWCALRGMQVTLQDREAKFIAPAIERAHKLFKKKLKKPRLIQEAMDRLMPDITGAGVAQADVIIEAIFENLEAKQTLFKQLENVAKKDAILATNTSSIPLEEISESLDEPSRLVGIHFFNPVAQLPLVEVVKGASTSDKVEKSAIAFVRAIDKFPLPVASKPGFLINRILMPYLLECVALLEEGVSGPTIDKAAEEFGMPMGPVELADTIGLDVCLSVAEKLTGHFGGTVPERLKQMVAAGNLGRKSGQGFYHYKKGKPVKDKANSASGAPDIANRLVYRMLNEAAACLREGVVSDADLLDVGMIFGTGFAPFTGGPMQYSRNLGESFQAQIGELENRYGDRFKADDGWRELKA